ncbi:MAG: hypothetical protein HYW49_09305 [Deltaproteobacteria bacterium]|nr:hypothetical protein [Deltaproteobacteria bacterium]
MREKLSKLKVNLGELLEKIKESEAYHQVKAKYDELDSQTKLYINLGIIAAILLVVVISVIGGVAKVSGLASDINRRDELIGYLQISADHLKQLKEKQEAAQGNADVSSPLPTFIENVSTNTGLNPEKLVLGLEKPGQEMKEAKEALIEVKLTQINLKQLARLLFNLTDQGSARNLNIRDLTIDTKGDPTGYLDAAFMVATYKAK